MIELWQGTTPTITATVDISTAGMDEIWFTLKQSRPQNAGGDYLLTKTKDELTLTDTTIAMTLTQKETLELFKSAGSAVGLQIRVRLSDGTAWTTAVERCTVADVLQSGVI
jgi:hypothetical protein